MVTDVEYRLESKHKIVNRNGYIQPQPAFLSRSRIYVIYNHTAASFPVYVGTAEIVQTRFTERINAIRALGFQSPCTDPIHVMVFQMLVNNKPSTPGNQGKSNGIDVEHIFIRAYTTLVKVSVRNISKTGTYTNTHGTPLQLSWTDPNGVGWVGPGGIGSYTIPKGGSL